MTRRAIVKAAVVGCVAGLLAAVPAVGWAQTTRDLRTLSLEDLMAIEVTTVTRLPQSRLSAPASVFVITQEDIRRSGATNVPELLRLAPGVHVSQIDGNKWAVGIRGFADRLARAMLVLVDGRAVYSPLFAGTYWEVQDLVLEDIDRIEVVRGPGGALWGANAVSGIVNIIRKRALASRGTAATAGTGSEDPAVIALRHGGARGESMQYRVSGKFAMRAPQFNDRVREYDDKSIAVGSARVDWQTGRGDVTLQGDIYRAVIGQRDSLATYVPPSSQQIETDDELWGGNLLGRWGGAADDPRAPRLQVYYDHSARNELVFSERQRVFDVDLQQGAAVGRHGLLWGAGYRLISGSTKTSGTLRFFPPDRVDQLVSGFVQDEVGLVRDRLRLIAGTKVEHNDYSGAEWQPSARLLWTPTPAHAVSMSVTRAVRTPSRVEHDFESGNLLNPAGPTFVRLRPNPDFQSEELVAYELGLVSMPHPRVMATIALFRNQHDKVMTAELGTTFIESDSAGTRTIVPVSFGNGLRGHSYGLEATADIRIADRWDARINYSGLRVHLTPIPGSLDITQEARGERGSPRHQVQLTSTVALPRGITVSGFFRYVSALPAWGVDAYGTSTVRVEWAPSARISVFAVGQNLHAARHAEFSDGANGTFEIQRAAFIGIRWSR